MPPQTMLSNHPFSWIPEGPTRRAALALAALAVVGISSAMRASSGALVGEGTRGAIVSLELAGSAARATAVMAAWESRGALGAATTNVWLDYPFLIAYATALGLATSMASDVLHARGWERLARTGVLLAWGALAAGGFDAIENVGLLHMLGAPGSVSSAWSWTTAVCAAMKFALVVAALLYAASGGIVWIRRRIAGDWPPQNGGSP